MKTTAIGASLCAVAIGLAGVGQAVAAPPVEALKDEQQCNRKRRRIPELPHSCNHSAGKRGCSDLYDGRPTGTDSPGPNSILQRRSTDGGNTWAEQTTSTRVRLSGLSKATLIRPYVYDEEAGRLFNFHVFSRTPDFEIQR